MTSLRNLGRRGWQLLAPAVLAATLLGGVLSACGGGTEQVDPFIPKRLIVFGDENSVIVDLVQANGRKYTVNDVDAAGTRNCRGLPIWVQVVATSYGFVFAECNPDARVPTAFIRAMVGAKIGDPDSGLARQIAAQAAAGGMNADDMATLLIGGNDVIELYEQVQSGELTFDAALVQARLRGTAVAVAANNIMAAGPRLLVATVPDMSVTPYAAAAVRINPSAISQLGQLNFEFNAYLRTRIDPERFDGRHYGLVLADDMINALARNPSSYGLTNVVDAVCRIPLPLCTDAPADLVAGAIESAYLWADDQHMAPSAHSRLGTLAESRARNNPF